MRKILPRLALLLVLFLSLSRSANCGEQPPTLAEDSVSGPDLLVGDINTLAQLGTNGSEIGLAMGATFCNNGNTGLGFALPNNDHPVVAQNLYRMSGGAANDERFEQVGQSWVVHCSLRWSKTFAALAVTRLVMALAWALAAPIAKRRASTVIRMDWARAHG